MKRIISIGLSVFIVMLSVIPTFAADSDSISAQSGIVKPQFTAIWSMSAGLSTYLLQTKAI